MPTKTLTVCERCEKAEAVSSGRITCMEGRRLVFTRGQRGIPAEKRRVRGWPLSFDSSEIDTCSLQVRAHSA